MGQTWTIYTEPTVLLNMACSCRAAALLRASDMNSTSFGIFGPPPPICQQNVLGLLRNSVYLLHSLSVQTSYTEAPNLAADKGNRRCFSLPQWREFKLRLIFAQSHSTTLEVADVGTSGVGTSLLSLHPFRMRRWRCNWRDGECDDSPFRSQLMFWRTLREYKDNLYGGRFRFWTSQFLKNVWPNNEWIYGTELAKFVSEDIRHAVISW